MIKILTVLAVIAVLTSAFPKISHQEVALSLSELDKDGFGQTMISTIALNIAVKNPVEEIIVEVANIEAVIAKEQGKADENNRTEQANCDNSINTYVQQIMETSQKIAQLKSSIANREEFLTQAKIDLASAEKDYEETVRAIESGTVQRQQEHSRWADEDYQQQIDIATLEEGVKLINHMLHGVAFSQIKDRYNKVVDKLSDDRSKHSTLFKPLILSLTQLATKLNYENVMKIIELLKNIRQSIIEEQTKGKDQEDKAQAQWETLLAQLTTTKQFLQDKITRLTTDIAANEEALAQEKASLQIHSDNLASYQDGLASVKAQCHEKSIKYQTESEERGRETQIMGRLKNSLQERFTAVVEFIQKRVGPEF